MPRRSAAVRVEDLTETEAAILRQCLAAREEMVYLVDLTTALAELPKVLRGAWFDPRLLDPRQSRRHEEVVKEVRQALRRLFRAGLVDIGREDAYPEGFRRHHREIVAAMHSDAYWRSRPGSRGRVPSMDTISENVRFHQMWADVPDLAAVTKELGGPVEFVGLTPQGAEFARGLAAATGP